jgi:single-stranded DNA-binding protein
MRKGAKVYVEGFLRTEVWDDRQTGQKRSKLVVVAERVGSTD